MSRMSDQDSEFKEIGWTDKPVTMEVSFLSVDPELIALLTGSEREFPEARHSVEVWAPVKRTFWQWLLRKPKQNRSYFFPNAKVVSPEELRDA